MLNSAYSLLVIASTTASFTNAYFTIPNSGQNMTGVVVNNIPPSKRIEYMRKTNEALYAQSGPCPFAAFGAMIVNHTSDSIVCEGANFRTGDPTIHGEISAINACTTRFTDEAQSWLSYVQSLKQHPRRTWLSFWQGLRAFRRQQTSCEDLHPVS